MRLRLTDNYKVNGFEHCGSLTTALEHKVVFDPHESSPGVPVWGTGGNADVALMSSALDSLAKMRQSCPAANWPLPRLTWTWYGFAMLLDSKLIT